MSKKKRKIIKRYFEHLRLRIDAVNALVWCQNCIFFVIVARATKCEKMDNRKNNVVQMLFVAWSYCFHIALNSFSIVRKRHTNRQLWQCIIKWWWIRELCKVEMKIIILLFKIFFYIQHLSIMWHPRQIFKLI